MLWPQNTTRRNGEQQVSACDRLAIAGKLHSMRHARLIPRVWIDADQVRIEITPDYVRRITWGQAADIAEGTAVDQVIRSTRLADLRERRGSRQ